MGEYLHSILMDDPHLEVPLDLGSEMDALDEMVGDRDLENGSGANWRRGGAGDSVFLYITGAPEHVACGRCKRTKRYRDLIDHAEGARDASGDPAEGALHG